MRSPDTRPGKVLQLMQLGVCSIRGLCRDIRITLGLLGKTGLQLDLKSNFWCNELKFKLNWYICANTRSTDVVKNFAQYSHTLRVVTRGLASFSTCNLGLHIKLVGGSQPRSYSIFTQSRRQSKS